MTVLERKLAEIGQGIAAARHAAGLSQQQLADKVGITRKDVSRVENGHPGVAWHKVAAILEALGRPLPTVKTWTQPSLEAMDRALNRKGRRT